MIRRKQYKDNDENKGNGIRWRSHTKTMRINFTAAKMASISIRIV